MAKVTAKHEILVVPNPDELNHRAAQEFVRLAEEAVRTKGFFSVALSGGSTPKGLYERLASDQYREQVPWPKVYVFWGDERCVPPDHPDSNYRMARESFLDKIPIPEENIYRMMAELEDHGRAAAGYEQTIKAFFHLETGKRPRFDLILLGMGEDGHTASLFPETPALEDAVHLVSANYIEKLGACRLTLTVPVINQASNVLFLIFGESKALVLKEVLEGEYQPQRLPSQLIRPISGRLLFIIDRVAASKLTCI
ncbi:MAG: 6-phosphogluconolactonase [Candidatus Brocadia sp.]|nr:6-phosphogluconolactonase [Candidatus Brocadia sp.]